MGDKKSRQQEVYLTVHGHFYQPPRENPWLEYIEEQPSAAPFHNWNKRVAFECYTPNSVARVVDHSNRILDIVNNYSLISFNFGPTLLSWLEKFEPATYQRILDADKQSIEKDSGHGNALAQVYNHIIMPLANYQDKITQLHWGIEDFKYRYKRSPEGLWLSETAVDDETLSLLIDYGIKFTVLSPFQAEKVRYSADLQWEDVSNGTIDPTRPYKYFLKSNPEKYIIIFFYDGSISRSVAFDNLLNNGDRLVDRIKDGISHNRTDPQLINLGTDGESYGHHTKFGDMALAYALKIRVAKEHINLINYPNYISKYPPISEVMIKENSSWSCFHGVGRWKEDCGCCTGAAQGWNQKWRKPLREALDWLNTELSTLYEKEGKRYFKDVWIARDDFISILLDRSPENIEKYFERNAIRKLSETEIVDAFKLLEIQKNAQYMFTSCGWFFADISGIETVQILRYAARAMQLAYEFGKDLENEFLNLISSAESNIKSHGNGKDIYLKFVKPSIVSRRQVVAHWAITSLFENYPDNIDVYSYRVNKIDYHRHKKGSATLVVGRIELFSYITTEVNDMIFGLLHFGESDFHCVIRGFGGTMEYQRIKEDLFNKLDNFPLTEVIRALDEHFGREYWTLKDLFKDKKRDIITELIKEQLEEFSTLYYKIYNDSQGSIMQLLELGLSVPAEFKIAAEYTLSRNFNKSIEKLSEINDIEYFKEAIDINNEANRIDVTINKKPSEKIFTSTITELMQDFALEPSIDKCTNIITILDIAEELDIFIDLKEPQNIFFSKFQDGISKLIENLSGSTNYTTDKEFISEVLKMGEKLNFNLDKHYSTLSKQLLPTSRTHGHFSRISKSLSITSSALPGDSSANKNDNFTEKR